MLIDGSQLGVEFWAHFWDCFEGSLWDNMRKLQTKLFFIAGFIAGGLVTLLVFSRIPNLSMVVQQLNTGEERVIFEIGSKSPKPVCLCFLSQFVLHLFGIHSVASVLVTGMEMRGRCRLHLALLLVYQSLPHEDTKLYKMIFSIHFTRLWECICWRNMNHRHKVTVLWRLSRTGLETVTEYCDHCYIMSHWCNFHGRR